MSKGKETQQLLKAFIEASGYDVREDTIKADSGEDFTDEYRHAAGERYQRIKYEVTKKPEKSLSQLHLTHTDELKKTVGFLEDYIEAMSINTAYTQKVRAHIDSIERSLL